MSEKIYDFESGDLSLDYANTKVWHASEKPEEKLNQYDDLVSWGEEAGLVSSESAQRLGRLPVEQPKNAVAAYNFAILLREAIYRIFSNWYADRSIPESDLALLNSVLREAMSHLQLSPMQGEIRWSWSPEIDGIEFILWPVAHSAAELLTSDKASRVHECDDDRGCGYLFIDQSKNRSRRWCSMESCGNRAKARRHYLKVQAG